ncbi:hypothetical protein K458DRAFT_397013 [Lentithecium fluviatile CBS 122367]|uniref:Glucose-methanol-choline oxidoreductase N-terminal domain-containing protein n=1 Tax=Lentithecium fluviatile CBS 122367 TaxID=1168545 RepID=A0A6G1IE06_9PLEO|nr:hypothetical protein K458DRAFT_397013 [Lentithecium fluviatile CBS 122367]
MMTPYLTAGRRLTYSLHARRCGKPSSYPLGNTDAQFSRRVAATARSQDDEAYDYIICGGGTAGYAIAE